MAENFNVNPYYDDFDPSKNYMRILFKPEVGVQAREMTQMQTILQDQISKFAANIFSQNTPVTGGKVTTNLKVHFIKLNQTYNNVNISAVAFLNRTIQNATGTVIAKVVAATEATGTTVGAGDPPTLIVTYLSGTHFVDNDTIYTTDGTNFIASVALSTTGNPSTGKSSVASISQGVFYVVNGYSQSNVQNPDGTYSKYSIGNFVTVLPQTTILDKYDNTPSYRIGLEIQETIVDYITDPSLLDPAIGASNYQAPGADRYQITLSLITLPLTLGNDNGFIELVRIENGSVVRQVDNTVYSVINDYIAKRDYESNGDYIVDDFKLTPSANTADLTKYNLKISKGVAYVRGYRVENQGDLTLISDRARTTSNANSSVFYVDYGNYFVVDTVSGIFDVTTAPQVDLHCVPAYQINTTNANTYNSTLIGSAQIRNLDYVSNSTDSNTLSYVYNAYVANVQFTSLNGIANTGTSTTLTINDIGGNFSTVANSYYGVTIQITGGTSQGDYRKIVSYSGASKTLTVSTPFTVIPDSTTQFSLLYDSTSVESIKNSAASANINVTGKVNDLPMGATIFENTSSPELLFQYGNPYVSSIVNTSYTSTKVFRNKTFTSVAGVPTVSLTIPTGSPLLFEGVGTLSTDAIKHNFTVIDTATGNILDMSTSGNTVSISSTQTTATLTSSAYLNKVVDVISTVFVSNGDATGSNPGLVLKAKNLIYGNTSVVSNTFSAVTSNTFIDLNLGQTYIQNVQTSGKTSFSLYVTDVKNIAKIIDSGSPTLPVTTSMLLGSSNDITMSFRLNGGQRDSFYDHASIDLIAGSPAPKGNILVIYNYYQHTGGDGYFSALSYMAPISVSPDNYASIGTYTAKDGKTYNLRDSIDFRPSRKNGIASFSYEYTGNPSVDDSGILIPKNLSNFISDYSYYLGRKDILILSKDNSFSIIEGSPSLNPVYPIGPDGAMTLAKISLDPYTAYVPGEVTGVPVTNLSINKVPHNRWAKSDITDLQTRVNNLEYYQSLNLLEQNAQSLQIPDVNGLNRFKNGILVDNFTSYATADSQNPDFTANINIRLNRLMPLQLVDNFQLQNPVVLKSLGTVANTSGFNVYNINGTNSNIFTLPATANVAVIQPIASSTISVNPFAVIVSQGTATLTPPMDNWVDNQAASPVLIADPNLQLYQKTNGVNVTNSSDWVTIPGTTVNTSSTVSGGSSQVSGSYNWSTFSPDRPVYGSNGLVTGIAGATASNYNTSYSYNLNSSTTYWSTSSNQLQNVSTSANSYTPIGAGYSMSGNVIQNVSFLPYIRPQQIIFRCKGLLVNTPVHTFFDGVNVDQMITSPDIIELNNVTGTFNQNDIIGYYTNNTFYPTGRVVSTLVYQNTSNVRLYISKTNGTPTYASTGIIQNAQYDSNGNYSGTTAQGLWNPITGSSVISMSGNITAVGGGYSPTNNGVYVRTTNTTNVGKWGTFMNQYSVWNAGASWWNVSTTFNNSVPFDTTTGGMFTFTAAASGTATVSLDGTAILSTNSSVSPSAIIANMAPGNHTISWTSTDNAASYWTPSGFALSITDSNGNTVWNTRTPTGVSYANVAQEIVMSKGGAWFTGVTQLQLDTLSSNVSNYYVGSQIQITSKFVYDSSQLSSTPLPPNPTVTGADGSVPSGGPGSGGSTGQYKIICHKLHELGLMDDDTFEADQVFGFLLKQTKPTIYYGYVAWAKYIVRGMDNKYFAKVVNILAKPWAKHMSYIMGYTEKDNLIGNVLMKIGTPICFIVGKILGK